MQTYSVRLMTEADLPGAGELRRLAGWNQTPDDWRRLLHLEPNGCFVAHQHEAIVGSVTTTAYGRMLAWIGMMLVHPEHRRRGLGRQLMSQALEYLQGCGVQCIKLDATPAGFPLYQQLGFIPEWNLTRWQRPADCPTPLPSAAFAGVPADLTEIHWRSIHALDTAAFGIARPRLLRSLAGGSRQALVWLAGDRVIGWGLLRPGANADYLGPMASADPEILLGLTTALLRKAENRSVFWDLPDQNEPAKKLAQGFGFTPLRPLIRMRLGPDSVPSNPQAQFAIADPAVG